MLPSSIRTAIDLKNAVESAPKKLKAIGTCVTATDEFKAYHLDEHGLDDEEMDADNEGSDSGEDVPSNRVGHPHKSAAVVLTHHMYRNSPIS